MRLEAENKSPVEKPTEKKLRSTILALRSYGPSSFASLTDDAGNYLQVAGGGVTCLLERRDVLAGRHFRAHHDQPSTVFADNTILAFSGGEVRLASDEWFNATTVADVFSAFLRGDAFPAQVQWRDVTQAVFETARV
jgi:hypothetical protein